MRQLRIVSSLAILVSGMWLLTPAVSQTPTGPATSEQLGHVRIERTIEFRKPWESYFTGDVIVGPDLLRKQVQTPQSTAEVDIILTVTLDVETGRSDEVSLHASYRAENGVHLNTMAPGSFSINQPGPRSTTTVTWAATAVPAGGETYEFVLRASVLDGKDRDRTASATGKRLTVVIEMWPAGR